MARGLFRQLLLPLVAVAAAATILFSVGAYRVLNHLYDEENARSFGATVAALAAAVPRGFFAGSGPGGAATWCAAVGEAGGMRITLIAPDGGVLTDTMADAASMANHGTRPEVAAALAGKTSTAHRRSATVGRELFYAAAPVYPEAGNAAMPGEEGRAILGVLRISMDLPAIEARLSPSKWILALDILFVALAATGAAALFSRRISSPLAVLAEASRAIAAGEWSRRIPEVDGPYEVIALAAGLRSMSSELDRRVKEAEAEGREKSAILDGMAEAVLALDHELRIRVANPAAMALFGFAAPESPVGQSLLRATRSTDLENAALDCLDSGEALEREIAIYDDGERWFQAFVTPLPRGLTQGRGDAGSRGPGPGESGIGSSGAVLVLNDITRLRRLERVRRDFVANVSHELRTPVQLIKGFAEALLEGAIGDPAKSARFLGIMERNAARMESLIDDLLTLARLEQEGSAWLQCEELALRALLEEAEIAVGPKAAEKNITIDIDCPEGLSARVNAGLFIQAVINLLDNAIKYSPPGSRARVSAEGLESPPEGRPAGDRWYALSVADQGMGIPARDLPKIFERFYRVDKARSRELGGTGLGLAIVRHIALAHGGQAAVESYEGEGSRFTIFLPFAGPQGPDAQAREGEE